MVFPTFMLIFVLFDHDTVPDLSEKLIGMEVDLLMI